MEIFRIDSNNRSLSFCLGDITDYGREKKYVRDKTIIVNAANKGGLGGGGVDGAITSKGGKILKEKRGKWKIVDKKNNTRITPLTSKYTFIEENERNDYNIYAPTIIHTVGPKGSEYEEINKFLNDLLVALESIKKTYIELENLPDGKKFLPDGDKYLAVPLISSGIFIGKFETDRKDLIENTLFFMFQFIQSRHNPSLSNLSVYEYISKNGVVTSKSMVDNIIYILHFFLKKPKDSSIKHNLLYDIYILGKNNKLTVIEKYSSNKKDNDEYIDIMIEEMKQKTHGNSIYVNKNSKYIVINFTSKSINDLIKIFNLKSIPIFTPSDLIFLV